MLSDFEIAQAAKKLPIEKIAAKLRIKRKQLIPYGRYIAKVDLGILEMARPRGKYILVTAITPTHLGEGKTVTTIGLSMALNRLGKLASACLRQPSLGPVFGIKGGASGGGYAQVLPKQEVNLHFTGDTHAVGVAHNLAAAFLDNSILKGNRLNIDLNKVWWPRVMDVNDRSLRKAFEITSASELMAILALSNSLRDLRQRLGRVVLADTHDNQPVTAEDLKVAGAMAALLKDALLPNLVQTIEQTPCFVHTGPFANIAHGNNSILADKIALSLCDYVVTESGFGTDCGAEKFFDIKCRISGLQPDAVVMVCSIRALKIHNNKFSAIPGCPLEEGLFKENIAAIEEGFVNLAKHIENIKFFGVPLVVVINRFASDTDKEIDFVKKKAKELGVDDCVVSEVWRSGSKGGMDLARAVVKAAARPKNFKFLYALELPIKEKIKVIASKIYGANDVEYSDIAESKIKLFNQRGWDKLPICMAKTQHSLSHNPEFKGRPRDFILPISDIRAALGAGFLIPVCGKLQMMPGLPTHPAAENIDIDEKGNIIGLL